MGIGLLGGRFVIKRAHKTEHQAILADLVKATEELKLDVGRYPVIGSTTIPAGAIYNSFNDMITDYENRSYLDVPFADNHGQSAKFYYYSNTNNDALYFCANNVADDYTVCGGRGVPAATPTLPTSANGAAGPGAGIDILWATY